MVTFISQSPEATRHLGECWGEEARAGWVFALSGDLGSGKTLLAQGIARGLGIPQGVRSPTFALILEHPGGRLPFYHLDLYRLESTEAIRHAGLEEFLCPSAGVAVVEWAERWFGSPPSTAIRLACPTRLRQVRMSTLGENERCIEYEDVGI